VRCPQRDSRNTRNSILSHKGRISGRFTSCSRFLAVQCRAGPRTLRPDSRKNGGGTHGRADSDGETVHNAFFDRDFRDTDMALLEFLDATVESTREINEDVYVDLDAEGTWYGDRERGLAN